MCKSVLLGKLHCYSSFRLNLYTFPPEFQLGVNGTMEDPVCTLGMEGRDWRMMTYLLAYNSKFLSFKFVGFS